MSICAFIVAVVMAGSGALSPAQSTKPTAPESFHANAQATSSGAGVASALTFQLDAYTPDADRERLLAALTSGGSPAFVEALKKEKAIGSVTGRQPEGRPSATRGPSRRPAADAASSWSPTRRSTSSAAGRSTPRPKPASTSRWWSSRSMSSGSGAARWRWPRASSPAARPACRSTTTPSNPSSW